MIELVTVFTKGGIVLWNYSYAALTGVPINDLIKTILLEDRSGQESFSQGNYTLKWIQANDLDLVFVVVYQKIIQLLYIDELLQALKQAFCDTFEAKLKDSCKVFSYKFNFKSQFETLYEKIRNEELQKKIEKKSGDVQHRPRKFEETERGKKVSKQPGKKKKAKKDKENDSDEDMTPPSSPEKSRLTISQEGSPGKTPESTISNKLKNLGLVSRNDSKKKPTKKTTTTEPERKPKQKQNWGKATPEELDNLNFSKSDKDESLSESHGAEEFGVGEKITLDEFEDSSDEETEAPQKTGGLMQFFKNMANKELTDADLEPVLNSIKSHLISKNVAQEISEKLCESVGQSLVGKNIGTFSRVSTQVRGAMEEALTRILTPKRNIDILREVRGVKSSGKGPYVIVFVGVNGVGKSTSLSKVCSWLQQNDLKVMICACDTFRAGAVEQLIVHAKNLNVPLYHKGYGKDAAQIAFEGINKARKEDFDVVLVDTAGRMQDNDLLMKALAKLVGLNDPHLVLFIGEALVGNEAVDQLVKFNRALEEFSTSKTPRGIDGIFLTKFDTVDDKVGAAISMAYTTGQPIVFVGVGQKYSDLKSLKVERIVQVLLKGH